MVFFFLNKNRRESYSAASIGHKSVHAFAAGPVMAEPFS